MRQLRKIEKGLMLAILLSMSHQVIGQIKQITNNRTERFQSNYVPRESPEDTVLIIFDTNQQRLELIEKIHMPEDYKFKYLLYMKSYPPQTNSCALLSFNHQAGPHLGYEEFLITKKKAIDKYPIIYESKTDYSFWFSNDQLNEKTLILIEEEGWNSSSKKVKGLQISFNTAFCDDVIDLTEKQ